MAEKLLTPAGALNLANDFENSRIKRVGQLDIDGMLKTFREGLKNFGGDAGTQGELNNKQLTDILEEEIDLDCCSIFENQDFLEVFKGEVVIKGKFYLSSENPPIYRFQSNCGAQITNISPEQVKIMGNLNEIQRYYLLPQNSALNILYKIVSE